MHLYGLHNAGDLQHVGGKMQLYWDASGIDHHISFMQEPPFLKDLNLVLNHIVNAFFFIIEKGADAPAETELIYQRSFLGKNI